jgi:hypothetical protein
VYAHTYTYILYYKHIYSEREKQTEKHGTEIKKLKDSDSMQSLKRLKQFSKQEK